MRNRRGEAWGGLDGFIVFDGMAEHKERKLPDIMVDPQKIGTIKELRNLLCTVAVPRAHKGLPRVSKCRTCSSQCAYGRRLIELMKDRKKEAEDLENETTAAPGQPVMHNVRLTKSQCENVAGFIESHLIDAIRNNTDIDNIEWVSDMIGAMHALRSAKG